MDPREGVNESGNRRGGGGATGAAERGAAPLLEGPSRGAAEPRALPEDDGQAPGLPERSAALSLGCSVEPSLRLLSSRTIIRRIYVGSGTPLQYSCLENPMDGGAW